MGSRTYLLLASTLVLAGCPDDPVSEGLDDDDGTSTGDPTTGSPTTTPTTDPSTTSSSTTSADSSSTGDPTVDPDTSSSGEGSSSSSSGEGSSSSSGGSSSSSTGVAGQPEIEVTVASVPVDSGQTLTAPGTTPVGDMGGAVTVEVTNTGDAALDLTGVSLVGAATHFTLDDAGLDASLEPAESTTFTVEFTPVNGGLKQTSVVIDNNDADENPFEIRLRASTTPNLWRNITPKDGPSARYNMALAQLGPGQLLTFGGRGTGGAVLGDTWLYDVEAGAWMDITPVDSPTARFSYGMDSAGPGLVVLTGGTPVPGKGGIAQGDTWHFDDADMNWVPSANNGMPPSRVQPAVAGFDGGLFLYGGIDENQSDAGGLFLYDAGTETWIEIDVTDPGPRLAAAAAFDSSGIVTLSGGFEFGKIGALDTAYDFVLADSSIAAHVNPALGTVYNHELVYLRQGFAVTFGGRDGAQTPRGDTFSYEPVLGTWTDLDPAVAPSPRFNFGMSAVGENKLIMFGGSTAGKGAVPTVEVWEYVGPLP